ncbi:MAG: hypothetical protein ACW98X_22480 [Promethearchaeota archaeon]|jgi:hypothetical protein
MSWWNKKWGKHNICPITQTRLRPGKSNITNINYVTFLPCKHGFYTKAILNWISEEETFSCPMCRERFVVC